MVRIYQESDFADIKELLNLLATSNEAYKFENCLFDADVYKEMYLVKKAYKTFVAVKDKVVGFVLGEHYCNDVFAILMLYIHPEFRREYYALCLKNIIVDYARENGYKQIISQVRTNNLESIKMNKRARWDITPDRILPDYYIECSKNLG
ncbi:MAG TPA: GNAT family N-acetyltransferase [Methanosarcinales archaeon]|nr:GNAT family N-acetyltransferase [Methanosarcinales archaeon]